MIVINDNDLSNELLPLSLLVKTKDAPKGDILNLKQNTNKKLSGKK